MASQADAVFYTPQRCANFAKNVAHVGLDEGAAAVKHGAILVVHNLDLQAVWRHIDADLRLVFVQSRVFRDHGVYLGLQGLDARCVLPGPLCTGRVNAHAAFFFRLAVRAPNLPVHLGQIIATARNHARTVARTIAARHGHLEGRAEISRNALQFTFGGGAQQPHQQKEGHHGRHEVGVGNLPRTTMHGMAALLDALDDDGLEFFFCHGVVLWRGVRLLLALHMPLQLGEAGAVA